MDNKTFTINILKHLAWPMVVFLLGLAILQIFPISFKNIQQDLTSGFGFFENLVKENAQSIDVIFSFSTLVLALFAYIQANSAGIFDKKPIVMASGIFVISTTEAVNTIRNKIMSKVQTLQVINIGKGYSKKIIISSERSDIGKFLEALCPASYILAPEQSSESYKEILRVNGGNINLLEKKGINFFWIYYEDYQDNSFYTKVIVEKILPQYLKVELNDILSPDEKELIDNGSIVFWKIRENIIDD